MKFVEDKVKHFYDWILRKVMNITRFFFSVTLIREWFISEDFKKNNEIFTAIKLHIREVLWTLLGTFES